MSWTSRSARKSAGAEVFPPAECVVYQLHEQERRYWQGPGSRVWRPGEAGRAGAARFPDMHTARAAIAALRRQRHRLPHIGYEWLPYIVVRLQLISEGVES